MREKLLTLEQAREWLREELGIVVSRPALHGWGYRATAAGTRLEMVMVSGRWMTTPGALKRFLTETTEAMGVVPLPL